MVDKLPRRFCPERMSNLILYFLHHFLGHWSISLTQYQQLNQDRATQEQVLFQMPRPIILPRNETIVKNKAKLETRNHYCDIEEMKEKASQGVPDATIRACHLHIVMGREHEPQLAWDVHQILHVLGH